MSDYGDGGDDNSRGTYNYRGTNRESYRGNNYGDQRSSSYQNREGGGGGYRRNSRSPSYSPSQSRRLTSGVPYRETGGRRYSRSPSRSRSRESDRYSYRRRSRSRSRSHSRNRDRWSRSRSRDRRSPPPSRSVTRHSDDNRGQGYASGSGERQIQQGACQASGVSESVRLPVANRNMASLLPTPTPPPKPTFVAAGAETMYVVQPGKTSTKKRKPLTPQVLELIRRQRMAKLQQANDCDNQQSTTDESVTKIRKVMRQRDMDCYDDDVSHTRIARRASPPPGPDIKRHGTWDQEPSAATTSFFGNAAVGTSSGIWGSAGPVKQEAMPSTSEDVAAKWSTQYHSSKPQQSGTPLSGTDLEERESSPPRSFVIPGLGDIEDEDKFLYGDDTEEDASKTTTPAATNRSRDEPESTRSSVWADSANKLKSGGSSGPDPSITQSSGVGNKEKLQSYMRRYGLDVNTSSTAPVSAEAAQRGAEVSLKMQELAAKSMEQQHSQVPPLSAATRATTTGYPSHLPPSVNASISDQQMQQQQQYQVAAPVQQPYQPFVAAPPTMGYGQLAYQQYYNTNYPHQQQQQHVAPLPVMGSHPNMMGMPTTHLQSSTPIIYPHPQAHSIMGIQPPTMAGNSGGGGSVSGGVSSKKVGSIWVSQNQANLKVIQCATTPVTRSPVGAPRTLQQSNAKPNAEAPPRPALPPPGEEKVAVPRSITERQQLREQFALLKSKQGVLNSEMERLRRNQNELMRKKQRQKDGHNDPQLVANSKLQEEITRQLGSVKRQMIAMEQALKVTAIMDTNKDKSQKGTTGPKNTTDEQRSTSAVTTVAPRGVLTAADVQRAQNFAKAAVIPSGGSPSPPPTHCSSANKKAQEAKKNSSATVAAATVTPGSVSNKVTTKTTPVLASKMSETSSGTPSKNYRFIDHGNHWCKHCNAIFTLAPDLLLHLHKKHCDIMEKVVPADRPWAVKPVEPKPTKCGEMTLLPFRGIEFILPCEAYFCTLCKEFSGDVIAERNHLESDKHNFNYSKFCKSNPSYAKRTMARRAQSLARHSEVSSKRKTPDDNSSSSMQHSEDDRDHKKRARSKSPPPDDKDKVIDVESDKPAETKCGIKMNLLKKNNGTLLLDTETVAKQKAFRESDQEASEEDDGSVITVISKPGAKITGRPPQTAESTGAPAATKTAQQISEEQQRTQRILSNRLKKKKLERAAERELESQAAAAAAAVRTTTPSSLEEVVCITTDRGPVYGIIGNSSVQIASTTTVLPVEGPALPPVEGPDLPVEGPDLPVEGPDLPPVEGPDLPPVEGPTFFSYEMPPVTIALPNTITIPLPLKPPLPSVSQIPGTVPVTIALPGSITIPLPSKTASTIEDDDVIMIEDDKDVISKSRPIVNLEKESTTTASITTEPLPPGTAPDVVILRIKTPPLKVADPPSTTMFTMNDSSQSYASVDDVIDSLPFELLCSDECLPPVDDPVTFKVGIVQDEGCKAQERTERIVTSKELKDREKELPVEEEPGSLVLEETEMGEEAKTVDNLMEVDGNEIAAPTTDMKVDELAVGGNSSNCAIVSMETERESQQAVNNLLEDVLATTNLPEVDVVAAKDMKAGTSGVRFESISDEHSAHPNEDAHKEKLVPGTEAVIDPIVKRGEDEDNERRPTADGDSVSLISPTDSSQGDKCNHEGMVVLDSADMSDDGDAQEPERMEAMEAEVDDVSGGETTKLPSEIDTAKAKEAEVLAMLEAPEPPMVGSNARRQMARCSRGGGSSRTVKSVPLVIPCAVVIKQELADLDAIQAKLVESCPDGNAVMDGEMQEKDGGSISTGCKDVELDDGEVDHPSDDLKTVGDGTSEIDYSDMQVVDEAENSD